MDHQAAEGLGVSAAVLGDDRKEDNAEPIDAAWIATQVDRLLALPSRPDGLLLPRAAAAGLLYKMLRQQGVEPGRDLKVVTCDRDSVLSALDPIPATIDVRPEVIGERAVEQVLWHIGHRHEPVRADLLVEPCLIAGEEHNPT